MKYSAFTIVLVSVCLVSVSLKAYGRVELYLYPNINTAKQQLQMCDIARIVGDKKPALLSAPLPLIQSSMPTGLLTEVK